MDFLRQLYELYIGYLRADGPRVTSLSYTEFLEKLSQQSTLVEIKGTSSTEMAERRPDNHLMTKTDVLDAIACVLSRTKTLYPDNSDTAHMLHNICVEAKEYKQVIIDQP